MAALMSRGGGGGGDNQSVAESSADDMPTPHHTSATAAVLAATAAPQVSISNMCIYNMFIHYFSPNPLITGLLMILLHVCGICMYFLH